MTVDVRQGGLTVCTECGAPSFRRDLCEKHYFQRRRAGTLLPSRRELEVAVKRSTLPDTFVDESGLVRLVGLPEEQWELERLVSVLEWLAEAYEVSDGLVPGEKRDVTIEEYVIEWRLRLAAGTPEPLPGREPFQVEADVGVAPEEGGGATDDPA